MKKHAYTIIIGLFVLLAIGAFFLREAPSETLVGSVAGEATSLGQIPETNIQNPDGSEVALASALERNSIINTWATWCPFCVNELPDFAEFAAEHVGSIDVLAVNRAESIQKGADFLKELGLGDSSLRIFYDEDESMYRALGGFSMPETIFVDATGEIRFHKRGPLTKKELEEITNNLDW